MKKKNFITGIWAGLIVVVLVLFVSCFMFEDRMMESAFSGKSGQGTGEESESSTQADKAAKDQGSGRQKSQQELQYSPNVMMFDMIFAQAFYLGGFGADFEDYKEGQGTIWMVETESEGEVNSFEAERALLKKNTDGSRWWYISYRVENENYEYEVLLNADFEARKIRFRDEEGSIQEYRYEGKDVSTSQGQAGGETYYFESEEDYEDYYQGTRTVTVGAGTYSSQYLKADVSESGANIIYEWWVTDEVPGKLVKFNYQNKQAGSDLRGELKAVKMGYTTKFNSF